VSKSPSLHIHLQQQYGNFSLHCDIDLPMQGVTVIFGRSGCGKTTLLRCIAGLTQARGTLQFDEKIWQNATQFVPTHRRPLAYVFQEPRLFPHLDVRGNLQFALKRVPLNQRRIQFDDAVAWLSLENLLAHKPAQLSGGQQQRVAIARALLASPQLLLMDEPLASLDIDSKTEILPYLERLHTQLDIPILYVTHALDEVARLADRVLLLDNGRVQAMGALNDLLTQPQLPLSHFDEASAVLDATITAHDTHYHLSQVAINGGSLTVALSPLPIGSHTRVRILARDVSIALQPPTQSSIQNSVAVQIVDISSDRDPARVLVRLALGDTHLLARITRRAADQLALQTQQTVYAQIKAVALMR